MSDMNADKGKNVRIRLNMEPLRMHVRIAASASTDQGDLWGVIRIPVDYTALIHTRESSWLRTGIQELSG
jgi:hypothetical protein